MQILFCTQNTVFAGMSSRRPDEASDTRTVFSALRLYAVTNLEMTWSMIVLVLGLAPVCANMVSG